MNKFMSGTTKEESLETLPEVRSEASIEINTTNVT